MLMSIIVAIAVAFFAVTAAEMLSGGGLSYGHKARESVTIVNGVVTESHHEEEQKTPFDALSINDWIRAIVLGLIVGVVNYSAPKLEHGTLWLAPAFLVAMLAIYVYLMRWWHREGSEWTEMIPFAILAILVFFPAKAAAAATTALWNSAFWTSVVNLLPTLFLVATLGFYVINYFYFRYREVDLEEDDLDRHHGLGILAIIVTTLLLIIILVMGVKWDSLKLSSRAAAKAEATVEEVDDAREVDLEAIEYLTVEKVTPEQLEELTLGKYKNVSQELLDSSLSPQDRTRVESTGFSDALTFGFNVSDNKARFAELEEEILRNPVYGVTIAKAIKDKEIGGKSIASFNPWMEEMVAFNDENGVAYWCEYRDDTNTIYVTDEYRQYAATLCTWLERLVLSDVYAWPTVENWCLNASASNNDRVGVPASYQYTKDALILAYVGKNGEAVFVIGFNIHDKRPEFYGGTPEKPTPTPTPTPEPGPGPTPTPGPGTNPTPTPNPTPNPSTPPYDKDKSKGTHEYTEPNDDPGPGPDTNNGANAQESTKDQPTNSNHSSYDEYRDWVQDMAETNQDQKTGGDPNTPSTTPAPGTNVDDNADNGTGYGGIDTPTSVAPPAVEAGTGQEISDSPGGIWGGPQD